MPDATAPQTPPSTIVYVVRHGQSIWNDSGLLAGWSDTPLSDLGRRQATAIRPLLQDLHFDGVYSSPLSRARDTATLAWGADFDIDARIKEFHFGAHEGVPLKELAPNYVQLLQDFENFHAEGGEIGRDFFARIDAFFHDLPPGQHLIFAHGGVIRRLLHHVGVKGFPTNGAVFVFDLEGPALIREIPNPLAEP